MPYKAVRDAKTGLYWVIKDATGEKMEKKPIPYERAIKQIQAIHISEKYKITNK